MIYHDISLDLSYPRGVNTIYIKRGSTGNFLRAKIFNKGISYDLSSYNISDIKIYSGQNVVGFSAIQKSGNELVFNIDPGFTYDSEIFTGDGTNKTFTLADDHRWTAVSVYVGGVQTASGYSYNNSTGTVKFNTAPIAGYQVKIVGNIPITSSLYSYGWVMCAIEMVKTVDGKLESTRTQNFQIFSEDIPAPSSEGTSTLGGFSPSDRNKIDKIQGGLGNNLGGFALGSGAVTDVGAIQLGVGVNVTAHTLQVYDKTLLNADGTIPNDRLSFDASLSATGVKPVQNKVIKAALDLKANQKYDTNGGGAIGDTAIATLGGGAVGKTASSSGGGAAIGNTASASTGGAAGKTAETTTGGAVGNSAKSTTGGAVGDDAEATSGGAIGYSSYATFGGAVGNNADEQAGGGAVGNTSSTQSGGAVGNTASSTSGGAVGNTASVTTGGAIGDGATTSIGFAGGYNAKTKNGTTKIDAIQLGTGTNATVKTLQVYDKTLLDASGIIPNDRFPTDIRKIESVTASANELNILTGATLSTTELNYVDGVTSGIQGQLDGKANSSHNQDASTITTGTLPIARGGTGATTAAGVLTSIGVNASVGELNYVDGVTSNIQSQLDGKSASAHNHTQSDITGLDDALSGKSDTDHVHSVATAEADGFLSKEDKSAYDDAVADSHSHANKDVLDKFSEVDGAVQYDGEAIVAEPTVNLTNICILVKNTIFNQGAVVFNTPEGASDSAPGEADGAISEMLTGGNAIFIAKTDGTLSYFNMILWQSDTIVLQKGDVIKIDAQFDGSVTQYTEAQLLDIYMT